MLPLHFETDRKNKKHIFIVIFLANVSFKLAGQC